jgi:hypothetical protein
LSIRGTDAPSELSLVVVQRAPELEVPDVLHAPVLVTQRSLVPVH